MALELPWPLQMSDASARRHAYRVWAASQTGLPPFWRAEWLDIVLPERWDACSFEDAFSPESWAWPFGLKRSAGMSYLGLPPCTPYLGPWMPTGAKNLPGVLPKGVKYGVFTVHQPDWAWHFGKETRSMATQVVDLQHNLPLDADLKRRLRRANEELSVRILDRPSDINRAHLLLQSLPKVAHPQGVQYAAAATDAGFGQLLGVFDQDSDELQGFGVLLFDASRAYAVITARSPTAHPSTVALLIAEQQARARTAGLRSYNFCSGFLPGVREFHARFGARAEWYGMVRLSSGPVMATAEFLRGLSNGKRL